MAIVTPAFVSDCLETLEEIAMEGEEIFHEAGGKEFTVIPCLNDRDDWAEVVTDWIDKWRIVDVKTANRLMKPNQSAALGTDSIGSLLIKQAVPASIGILVMSLNILVDTIFVGNWIGSIAIAAINVVLPVSFFIAALGMAIGIGGSSIISRALGADNKDRALKTFGNQITLTLLLTTAMVVFGLIFINELIPAFGGKGDIFEPAKIYYRIVLYGVPLLALCMMGNNVIRAEGKPKFAMIAMIIPSVGNLLLDYILINLLDMGMAGAAWATTISYGLCFLYVLWFFLSDKSELKIRLNTLWLKSLP